MGPIGTFIFWFIAFAFNGAICGASAWIGWHVGRRLPGSAVLRWLVPALPLGFACLVAGGLLLGLTLLGIVVFGVNRSEDLGDLGGRAFWAGAALCLVGGLGAGAMERRAAKRAAANGPDRLELPGMPPEPGGSVSDIADSEGQ